MSRTRDAAVVLKALELWGEHQQEALTQAMRKADALAADARTESDALKELVQIVDSTQQPVAAVPAKPTSNPGSGDTTLPTWEECLAQSRSLLRASGVDLAEVRLEPSTDALTRADVAMSVVAGIMGVLVPSIGSKVHRQWGLPDLREVADQIEQQLDSGHIPEALEWLFGEKPAAWMDAGASGQFHRFVAGHELLTAVPEAIARAGWLLGPWQVFQHLFRDSLGKTGIPMPGSTLFAQELMSEFSGVKIRPQDLSDFAGFRMVDLAAPGTTALILFAYERLQPNPVSPIRSAKLRILGHGVATIGGWAMASMPWTWIKQVMEYRSLINYASLLGLIKNCWTLQNLALELRDENLEVLRRIRTTNDQLWGLRFDKAHQEVWEVASGL